MIFHGINYEMDSVTKDMTGVTSHIDSLWPTMKKMPTKYYIEMW